MFLGAGRALLLQLAHPWIAAAIEQHSDTFANPIARFHRTFGTMFTMVFGTLDQSLSAARRLHRRHAAITGTLPLAAGPFPKGSFYCANAIPRCAGYTPRSSTQRFWRTGWCWRRSRKNSASSIAARSSSWAACSVFRNIPRTEWTAFAAYFRGNDAIPDIDGHRRARVMANRLLAGADTWPLVPPSYKALTASLLPPRLRDAFELPYGAAERRAVEEPHCVGSVGLSASALSAAIRWALPGGATATCGTRAPRLYDADEQPLLDRPARPAGCRGWEPRVEFLPFCVRTRCRAGRAERVCASCCHGWGPLRRCGSAKVRSARTDRAIFQEAPPSPSEMTPAKRGLYSPVPPLRQARLLGRSKRPVRLVRLPDAGNHLVEAPSLIL